MKNIMFWSNASGKSGTSGNMLAISTMSTVLYSLKTLLVQFDKDSNPLTRAFENGRKSNLLKEEFSFYNRKGLDEVCEKAKIMNIGREEILDNTVHVKHTNLYYMPPSRKSQEELCRELDGKFLKDLLQGMKAFESINFIDCMNGKNELSEQMFEDCDMIVVNLFQGMDYPEEILENPYIRGKSLFVIGRYDELSYDSLDNIRRKYNIDKECIGVVPYNIRFHDAMNSGKLIPFITKGIFTKKGETDYSFIIELFHTTNMILRRAGYEGL